MSVGKPQWFLPLAFARSVLADLIVAAAAVGTGTLPASAQDAGIKALRPGVTGREVHELVEDIIWNAGYDTLRPGQKKDPSDTTPRGFIHATGHGVGLELHEAPVIARSATKPLVAGDVVTIEPGVYDPALGGVRLEDMLVITEMGARNFTQAPRELVV